MSWAQVVGKGTKRATGSSASGNQPKVAKVQQSKASKSNCKNDVPNMFNKYANDPSDELPGRIGPNGVLRLLQDVGAEPTDCSVLIFAWKCKAQTQCEFTDEEWTNGLKAINCKNLDNLRQWFKNARNCIQKPADFKDFYNFAFTYAKSLAQRSLAIEVAIAYWQVIYGDDQRVNHWIQWLQRENKRGISKDEWTSYGEFAQQVKPNLSNYDEAAAWPLCIDDYVEFCKSEKK